MPPVQYAVVAYVRNAVGRWVEEVRKQIQPEQAHLPAHLTILPPRTLQAPEPEALATLESLCAEVSPFEVTLGDVETFVPTTPTVFIRLAYAAYKMRELHDRLNTGILHSEEPWLYMPHLTVMKMADCERAQAAFATIVERWSRFRGPRRVLVDQITFVRESQVLLWHDVAPIQLGRKLAPQTR